MNRNARTRNARTRRRTLLKAAGAALTAPFVLPTLSSDQRRPRSIERIQPVVAFPEDTPVPKDWEFANRTMLEHVVDEIFHATGQNLNLGEMPKNPFQLSISADEYSRSGSGPHMLSTFVRQFSDIECSFPNKPGTVLAVLLNLPNLPDGSEWYGVTNVFSDRSFFVDILPAHYAWANSGQKEPHDDGRLSEFPAGFLHELRHLVAGFGHENDESDVGSRNKEKQSPEIREHGLYVGHSGNWWNVLKKQPCWNGHFFGEIQVARSVQELIDNGHRVGRRLAYYPLDDVPPQDVAPNYGKVNFAVAYQNAVFLLKGTEVQGVLHGKDAVAFNKEQQLGEWATALSGPLL